MQRVQHAVCLLDIKTNVNKLKPQSNRAAVPNQAPVDIVKTSFLQCINLVYTKRQNLRK